MAPMDGFTAVPPGTLTARVPRLLQRLLSSARQRPHLTDTPGW